MSAPKSTSRLSPFVPDDRQREAIEHVDGPMLVVAGAGTGKTSVLTHRIERLVREGHARSDEILALTYTVNAANEMQERVRNSSARQFRQPPFTITACNFFAESGRTSACSMRKIYGFIFGAVSAISISNTTSAPPMSGNSSPTCWNSSAVATMNSSLQRNMCAMSIAWSAVKSRFHG